MKNKLVTISLICLCLLVASCRNEGGDGTGDDTGSTASGNPTTQNNSWNQMNWDQANWQ